MELKRTDNYLGADSTIIVEWGPQYATGIDLIDTQHKALVDLTNQLYKASLIRDGNFEAVFKDSMSRLVEYVRFHFSAENELLERVEYPNHGDHKKEHEILVMQILDAAKAYEEGNKFAPNALVRDLKDWVFGHIALVDREYSAFVAEQKKNGLLTDEVIEG